MSTTRQEGAYSRIFRQAVAIIRAPRPHEWPVVGQAIGRAADRVMSRLHPGTTVVEGHLFRLDPRDDLGLARGRPYEPLLREMMERHIRPGATVIDGGAHIGYHTLLAARLVGPAGRVVAVEPAPATYALLRENVERNGYDNVTLVNGALSDRSGRGALHLSTATSGDHRIAPDGDRNSVDIELYTIDGLLPVTSRVDFIKLDVQGAEPLAWRGARQILATSPDLVAAVEYDPSKMPASAPPRAFLDELFERFRTILDVNDETGSVEPTAPERLLERYPRETDRHTNLICLPR